MYSAAYFEKDPRKVVEAGLACIPAESPYGKIIGDVLDWSKKSPTGARCGRRWKRSGTSTTSARTAPIARSTSTPSSTARTSPSACSTATAIGSRRWKSPPAAARTPTAIRPARWACSARCSVTTQLPESDKAEIAKLADTKFSHTDYSFNDIVKSTESSRLEVIRQAGGTVNDTEVDDSASIAEAARARTVELRHSGKALAMRRCRPGNGRATGPTARTITDLGVKETDTPGSEATLKFNGTGLALVGHLAENGGRADVYIDGKKSDLVADAYIVPNTIDDDLWRVFGLEPGEHTLRLVVRDDADSRSSGRKIMISRAIVFSTTK